MTITRRPARGGKRGHEPRGIIDARAERAWELHLDHRSQREIAAELSITQVAVCKILRRKGDQHAAAFRDDHERREAVAYARNGRLYRESLDGYKRSQTDETWRRRRETTGADGVPRPILNEAEVHTRDGDPRYLEQAGRALEREITLLGGGRRGGRARGGAEPDPAAARLRLARRLDRLTAASDPAPLAGDPE